MSNLCKDVLNLVCLIKLYDSPDISWTSIHVLVLNLGTLLDVSSSRFITFWYSFLLKCLKQS